MGKRGYAAALTHDLQLWRMGMSCVLTVGTLPEERIHGYKLVAGESLRTLRRLWLGLSLSRFTGHTP